MPPDQNQNINLLPHDLNKNRGFTKSKAKSEVEYTIPEATTSSKKEDSSFGKSSFVPNFLKRRKLPPLASSITPQAVPEAESKPEASLSEKLKPVPEPSNPHPTLSLEGRGNSILASIAASPSSSSEPKSEEPKIEEPVAPPPEPPQEPKQETILPKEANPVVELSNPHPSYAKASEGRMPNLSLEGRGNDNQSKKKLEEPKQEKSKEPAFGVNLLSQEYTQVFVLKNQITVFFLALVVTGLAIVVAYLGIWFYGINRSKLLEAEQGKSQALSSVILNYSNLADEDDLLKRKITAIKALFKKHISLKTFLEQLEAVTLPAVSYKNIAISGTGGVNLSARATDYTVAARQLAIFKQETPWVKEVIMTGARQIPQSESKEGGVLFDLSFKVDESVFISKE